MLYSRTLLFQNILYCVALCMCGFFTQYFYEIYLSCCIISSSLICIAYVAFCCINKLHFLYLFTVEELFFLGHLRKSVDIMTFYPEIVWHVYFKNKDISPTKTE